MARVEKGEVQLPVTVLHSLPENPLEYGIAVLRMIARKDAGEPLTTEEREAARMACRLHGRDWR